MIINIKEDLEKRIRNWNLDSIVKKMTTKEEQYNSLVHEDYTCVKELDLIFEALESIINSGFIPQEEFSSELLAYLPYRKTCRKDVYNNKIFMASNAEETFAAYYLTTENKDITWQECKEQGIQIGDLRIDESEEENVKLNGTEVFHLDNTNVKLSEKVEYMGRYLYDHQEPVVEKYVFLSTDGGENYDKAILGNMASDEMDWEVAITKGLTLNDIELSCEGDNVTFLSKPLKYANGDLVYKYDMIEVGGKYILGE